MALESIKFNQFSAGWCPSDDSANGRKNGLLQMTNVELDANGALILSGGTTQIGSNYANGAIDIFSNTIGATRHDYVSDTAGATFRDGTSILTSGSTSRVAYGSAYNYTLICSGTINKKDNGTTIFNLGITAPGAGPTVASVLFQTVAMPSTFTIISVAGTCSNSGGFCELISSTASGSNFIATCQTSTIAATDLSNMTDSSGTGATTTESPNDLITIAFSSGAVGQLANIISVQFDFLLVVGDGAGDITTDYFTTAIDSNFLNASYFVSAGSEFSNRYIRRNAFTRIGTNTALNWSTVKGFRVTLVSSANITTFINVPVMRFTGGEATDNADGTTANVQYLQVNVRNDGSYVGMSVASPQITVQSLNGNTAFIITPYITGIDSQVTEIWVFRNDSSLGGWYRVLVFLAANWTTPQVDATSSTAALALDIIFNINLISTASIGIILGIIGPIEGRWMYFTNQYMYPSDINDPDLVDPTLAVTLTGSTAEIFLFAKMITFKSVIVGTGRNFYILSGTFVTLPDQTIDIFYGPLSNTDCPYPPIAYDASVYGGVVYYIAKDGWRSIDLANTCNLIVAPNTDRLYRGDVVYGYTGPTLTGAPGSVRFPNCIARNKLWCSITGQNRIEVYDFERKYWRAYDAFGLDCLAIYAAQNGFIEGFYGVQLFQIDDRSVRIGSFKILSTIFDNGTPRQRKDPFTLKGRYYSGATGTFIIKVITSTSSTTLSGLAQSGLGANGVISIDSAIDISSSVGLGHWYQFQIINTSAGSPADFILEDLELFFDTRPVPLTNKRIYTQNFGTAGRKRLRNWPITIDSGGVGFTASVFLDGSGVASASFSGQTGYKKTINILETTDLFTTDAELIVSTTGNSTFELWDVLNPDFDPCPIQRRYFKTFKQNFGQATLKQLGLWAISINTFGNNVTANVYADGTLVCNPTINTAAKATSIIYALSDLIGTDWELELIGANPFELYDTLDPIWLQVYPAPKVFEQFGPQHFFRVGTISKFETRIFLNATAGTKKNLIYTVYFNDNQTAAGTIVLLAGENTYLVEVPKGNGGSIVRISLDSQNTFIYYPYYIKILTSVTGVDSEKQWMTING